MGERDFDVVVAGGGPSGATVAHALAREGVRVAVVDRAVFPRDKTCGGGLQAKLLPYLLADPSARHLETDGAGHPVRSLLRRPSVAIALVALIVNQAVMVLVMTMTPLHMTSHGHGLAAVGLVISGHTFGMFALSPISGRLADRFGPPPIVAAGLVVSGIAAGLSALAPPDGGLLLGFALFLLGFGWNLGYVAGSSILTGGLAVRERTRLQGAADALIWSSSAIASLASGVIVAAASFTALGLLGAALIVGPAWLVVSRRNRLHAVSRA